MYLAIIGEGEEQRYIIRKSYFHQERDCYCYRSIFDLGSDPSRYIEQYSENVFCFNESLEEGIARGYDGDPTPVLEELLWDFLPVEEKQRIMMFRRHRNTRITPLTAKEKEEINHHIHLFDRRRIYYIRYGAVDQGRIFRLDDKIYRPLLFKCRDEKEYYFKEQERVLEPVEFKTYIYAIFNLQQSFSEIYASFMPEALDQEKVEDSFIRELCGLNGDRSFWSGEKIDYFLHKHLYRYIIRFFDLDFQSRSFDTDFVHSFHNAHRKFRWPERKSVVTEEEVDALFGEKIEVLKKMQKEELVRLFRKKAKEYHPDRGGDHERFIKLSNIYDVLRKR